MNRFLQKGYSYLACKKYVLLLLIVPLLFENANGQVNTVIPHPWEVMIDNEVGFLVNKEVTIKFNAQFLSEANILASYLKDITGVAIAIKEQDSDIRHSESEILLEYDKGNEIPKEGYVIEVSNNKINIRSSDPAGIYYGCMTLIQSIIVKNKKLFIPGMHIVDKPRFKWRGLMLDCSRTFISIDYLKKTIDRMSFYKLNRLHLHLTDDQGWRLQIKEYPLLTSKGAFFSPEYNEPNEFEGFYTQVQMKELINYAHQRHVEIVPEIEFPGHSHAALYAYPELSCSDTIAPIFPFGAGPNMTASDVFNVCSEETYLFFKNIIGEVTKLFSSPYIHLGGDEVASNAWKNCKECQVKMKELGIKNKTQLQGYAMKRVGRYVSFSGKRPIGWDEVFSGNVGKNWIIMVWRDKDLGLKEVKAGYDIILTPRSYLYFDYSYRATPTSKVYSFEPVPNSTTSDEENHYLGIEACFWNHVIRTETRMDYQIYPRLLALAERAWSKESKTNYDRFYNRMLKHVYWFNYFDIKYNTAELNE